MSVDVICKSMLPAVLMISFELDQYVIDEDASSIQICVESSGLNIREGNP